MPNKEFLRQQVLRVISQHMFKCDDCKELIAQVLVHAQNTEDVSHLVSGVNELEDNIEKKKDEWGNP